MWLPAGVGDPVELDHGPRPEWENSERGDDGTLADAVLVAPAAAADAATIAAVESAVRVLCTDAVGLDCCVLVAEPSGGHRRLVPVGETSSIPPASRKPGPPSGFEARSIFLACSGCLLPLCCTSPCLRGSSREGHVRLAGETMEA
mmetsp:Transcript_5215/g.15959  ORF Transcript_5215/g.15959 Transcript_5215/m.15959 type:complete len:146 (-) Transcript_5215:301-738(-)